MRFQYECEKKMTSNQLNNMTVNRIPMTEEAYVPNISETTDKTVDLEKKYCYFLYVLLHLKIRVVLI